MSLDGLLGASATNESLLSAFLEQIPAGIVVFDLQGQPLLHNTAFTEIVGVVPARVQDLPIESDPARRVLEGEEVVGENLLLSPAGRQPRQVRVSALLLRASGEPSGAVLLLVASGSAEAGDIREILGVVGHDLRNPLAAMRMTAQLLGKPQEMTSERRGTLAKRILTSSGRMEAIVRGLLDYARASAGAIVNLQREAVDLAALTERVIEEQEHAHAGRSAERRVSGNPSGNWDPGRLEQVVAHLVGNAFRHGAESPRPVVSIDGTAPDRVRLAVENHGQTIAPELLARIFQPFSIAPRPPGTPRRQIGLGLFVVHEMVSAHGGSVSGSSSAKEGTRFEVSLPRAPEGVTQE
jgi:signal transduction histidine kinase